MCVFVVRWNVFVFVFVCPDVSHEILIALRDAFPKGRRTHTQTHRRDTANNISSLHHERCGSDVGNGLKHILTRSRAVDGRVLHYMALNNISMI